MKINQTIVTTNERTIMYSIMLGAFVEVQENYDYTDFSENPLESLDTDYYMPYDWRGVAQSKYVLETLKELSSESLEKANHTERKEFFEKVINELVDIEYMENSTLQEIFDNEISECDLLDYLTNLSYLINKYTDKTMLPINVYTHSYSDFSIGNNYSDAFIIVDNDCKQDLEKTMDYYSEWFNGWIYEVTCYNTLENAINEDDCYISDIYSSDMYEFENTLREIKA